MQTNRPWPTLAQPPDLVADEVHAWSIALDVSPEHYEELLTTLAPNEQRLADSFRLEQPRQTFVVTRAALRTLLGAYLELEPSEIALGADGNQKPRLGAAHAASGLQFNVSHSGGLALVAVARGCAVGIDVERVRDVGGLDQIAQRYFHSSENSALRQVADGERNAAFLHCWTAKEAILKAVGTGILGDLADFAVSVDAGWQGWVECADATSADQRTKCWLERLTPHDEYVAAIACVNSRRTIRTYSFSFPM